MNKKGFTLVELLAIIAILGIIAAIAAPNINKQIAKGEEENKKILNQKIENASKLYAAKYYAEAIVDGKEIKFKLNDLIEDGVLNLGSGECEHDVNKDITFIGSATDYSVLNCYTTTD